jgi:hypothetical protein
MREHFLSNIYSRPSAYIQYLKLFSPHSLEQNGLPGFFFSFGMDSMTRALVKLLCCVVPPLSDFLFNVVRLHAQLFISSLVNGLIELMKDH